MAKNNFMMKPKVDFCFKELMEDRMVRLGFTSALLKISLSKTRRASLDARFGSAKQTTSFPNLCDPRGAFIRWGIDTRH